MKLGRFRSFVLSNDAMVQRCYYVLNSLWQWRVDQCIASIWLCTVSTIGSELSVFGKMGTRHQRLQSYWQENLPPTSQDAHKVLKMYEE